MLISKVSPLTGKINTMDINITEAQLLAHYSDGRTTIQEKLPQISPDEREFIKTGYTPSDWAFIFKGPDRR